MFELLFGPRFDPRPQAPSRPGRAVCAVVAGLALAMLSAGVVAGDLRAFFDRRQVHEGDTVTLTIERDGAGDAASPDLSPLQQDFEVLGTSSGTQIRIVNGARSDTTSWQVTLTPKRTGVLRVPAISVGSDHTEPLTLTVAAAPQGALGSPGDDVFVEVEVGDGSQAQSEGIFVQQQVPLTVRLYSARPLLSGDLSEPRVADATLAKLGEDRQYRTQRQGREYQVVERRYTLSPEKSGELRIPPVVFKGTVRAGQAQRQRRAIPGGVFDDPTLDRFFHDPDLDRFFGNVFSGRDPFGMFERGEPVRAQSKALELKVKARPEGAPASHWLPAQDLTIEDSWTQDPPQLRAGEPVTRTLTLTAKGLSGSQVPEVSLPEVEGLRTYPEKAETETRTDGETVYGVSRQTFTLIPSRPGSFAIPEVRVPWWSTATQQEQVASLPAWNLQAEPGPSGAGPQQGAAGVAQPQPPAASPGQHPAEAGTAGGPGAASGGTDTRPLYRRPMFLWGAALVLLGILGAAILWRRRQPASRPGRAAHRAAPGVAPVADPVADPVDGLQGRGPVRTSSSPRRGEALSAGLAEARRSLQDACQASDPQAAARALLRWAEALWPEAPPRSLGALAMRITPAALGPLQTLERRLYGPADEPWDGDALWQSVKDGLAPADASRAEVDDGLAPLYPRRGPDGAEAGPGTSPGTSPGTAPAMAPGTPGRAAGGRA